MSVSGLVTGGWVCGPPKVIEVGGPTGSLGETEEIVAVVDDTVGEITATVVCED